MADAKKPKLTHAERIFVRISVLQAVLAVVGIFTGSIALYAALNEADAVRKQQQASVWPRLVVATSTADFDALAANPEPADGPSFFKFIFINSGIGPAQISAVRVAVDGIAQTNWSSVLEALTGRENIEFGQSTINGAVIRPGETYPALLIGRGEAAAVRGTLARPNGGGSRIIMDVCYCSVFDSCWLTGYGLGLDFLKPEPVKQCPDYGDEEFSE